MIEILDTDIEYAEKIFLPEGCSFDLERRDVIKCLESKDIQACPGSGKTTALLAKLAILAQKMPLENNKGICVLTHTNVAINEIKGKLGRKGGILFSYPNYFGTIQSFVDRYLAIPACICYYNTRPSRIDSDSYDFEITKRYQKLPRNGGLRGWMYNRFKQRPGFEFEYLKGIRFDFINECFFDINGNKLNIGKTSPSYQQLFEIKMNLLKEGILHYDDAYSLAFKYLRDFGIVLKKAFSERFTFIFIDEMQDTNLNQNSVLEQIFDESIVVIQRFGDINQAIYDGFFRKQDSSKVDTCLCINESKRFSSSIAKITQKLCVHEQNVVGNSLIQEIQPKFLVFDDNTIRFVLPHFVEIIKEYNLCNEENVFKAVGWVGKESQNNRTLPSYYQNFKKKSHPRKIELTFLNEYLLKVDDNIIKIEGAEYYRQLMINALLKVVKLLEVKDPDTSYQFTERTLIQYLVKKDTDFVDNFNSNVAIWCLKINSGEDISEQFKSFILNDFCLYFNDVDTKKLNKFFENSDGKRKEQLPESNLYDELGVKIEVATVHSVKGETHTATLYLETWYDKDTDIHRIIKYLTGRKKDLNDNLKASLKVAYVGMTRPTCLLCVAAHKNSISGHEKYLKKEGWELREVKNGN